MNSDSNFSWSVQVYFLVILVSKTIGLWHSNDLCGEGNGNPLQYSCLENPVDRGVWWAAVHRVARSWTWLKQLSMHACIGEGNGNPLQCSCLENPRDRGAWRAAVYGVSQSWTQLMRLSSSSSSSNDLHVWCGKVCKHCLPSWCNPEAPTLV